MKSGHAIMNRGPDVLSCHLSFQGEETAEPKLLYALCRWWSQVATAWNFEAHTHPNIQLVKDLYMEACAEHEDVLAVDGLNEQVSHCLHP